MSLRDKLEEYYDGIDVSEEEDGTKTLRPKNPDPSFGNNETACWASLGYTPEGHVVKVATGGAASMDGRLYNYFNNGNNWIVNS